MIKIDTSTVLVDTERVANVDELLARMSGGDERYRYSVSWVDTLATGRSLGRGVLYRGNHLARHDGTGASQRSEHLAGPKPSPISIPDIVPGSLVGPHERAHIQ